jgi:hypothetical protein
MFNLIEKVKGYLPIRQMAGELNWVSFLFKMNFKHFNVFHHFVAS